jgi:hypothetical protein
MKLPKNHYARTDWYRRRCTAEMALRWLAVQRDNLRMVGADKAANAVARAMKSVDGAGRHAAGRYGRDIQKAAL